MEAKTWKNFFGDKNQETEQINEDHKKGKDEQKKFICGELDKMSSKEIKEVYDYIESEVWKKTEE